ncbi:Type II secretion system protein E [Sulfitobacter noctilucicola]|uniref:Pilus assembly protein CpaF n=1 Tax=Sulfitobacter noctilucicola TaxID=1342301 RepID=A0A7W6M7A5_9RHOB|nr:CpaF family protein [Sulfitobacter noctilucicola]KIN62661.1 Type II secretion system protein E [Sulfitobacter noctilucicola]MBB4172806.1 pilus assembly protein CpaF [Sulfitobacter noctilucicola]
MTLHVSQPSLRDTLEQVLAIAEQIDAEGLSPAERANVAVTFVVESSEAIWPLALQRQILSDAVAALEGNNQSTAAPNAHTPVEVQTAPRLAQAPQPDAQTIARPSVVNTAGSSSEMMTLSSDMIRALSEILDFSELTGLPRADQERSIHDSIRKLSEDRKMHLNGQEVSDLVRVVLADMLGLGPLEALLADDRVTDIMVNGPHQVYVERSGKLELTSIRFRDNAHVFAVASRIVAAVGRRIDESQPMVDARLEDGSRVNVAVPPLAIDGPTITIRKFPTNPINLDSLVEGGSMTAQMASFLELAAFLRLNVLVSGGTGSGKTTLMNAMSQFIPEGERLVTIEDAAELRFQQPHVVRFETRPSNVEGTGEVTMRTLVRNALRMRPDRIIIGEIRGDEVLDLLQAMNTGHDGSMSTLHANSPREALTRVESMAALAGFAPGAGVVRRQLTDAVHLIVQVSRMRDGKRRITSISEIAGLEGDAITLQELFAFHTDPSSTRTAVRGEFRYSGFQPKFATRAAEYGVGDELASILGGRS